VLATCPYAALFAETGRTLDEIGVTPIPAGIVQFQQVTFDYAVGRIADSDWGQVVVLPGRVLRFTRGCEGYLNVFVPDAGGRLAWVVDNLFIAGPGRRRCSGIDQEGLEEAKRHDPFSPPPDTDPESHVPVVKDLDLRPGVEGQGRLLFIDAVVWFSKAPLPNADEYLRLAESAGRLRYRVEDVVENAEGDLMGSPTGGIGNAGHAAASVSAVAADSTRVASARSHARLARRAQRVPRVRQHAQPADRDRHLGGAAAEVHLPVCAGRGGGVVAPSSSGVVQIERSYQRRAVHHAHPCR
jgi:hypothetical protein